tara:strand:- start:1205 stop:1558 length:354 start_codon:yes stop_codon:yes gene_type:complete
MDIEPLKYLIKGSGDVKETIFEFLSGTDKEKIRNWEYKSNIKDLYINDRILCIQKNILKVKYIGRICYMDIEHGRIGLHLSKYSNISINPKDYYFFIKIKSEDIRKREIMKQILEKL